MRCHSPFSQQQEMRKRWKRTGVGGAIECHVVTKDHFVLEESLHKIHGLWLTTLDRFGGQPICDVTLPSVTDRR